MPPLQPLNARTGAPLGSPLPEWDVGEIDAAARAAAVAFGSWSQSDGAQRAGVLRALADALEAHRGELVALADEETALGSTRLNGELDRTCYQLRRFAELAASGAAFAPLDDPAVPGPPPAGHPALLRIRVPLGPVAVFAASNFPFAFSVLGGDTASALAAGCPVVVKAHPAHARLSQRVLALSREVLGGAGLPMGLIGLVQGAKHAIGLELVQHPAVCAVAFTGSLRAGLALQAAAQARPRPIPFYGELGALNPVVVLPAALETQSQAQATLLAGSITQGSGQFCTKPGIILLLDAPHSRAINDRFIAQLGEALAQHRPHPMLTSGILHAFEAGVAAWKKAGAETITSVRVGDSMPRPTLAQASASRFLSEAALHEEVFGPASLIVRAEHLQDIVFCLEAIGGSLTVTLWGVDTEGDESRSLVRAATSIAGRVLFGGVPTGVAVSAGQHHGGPWPSTTCPMSTSVGDAAVDRFLRPVALQDPPPWLRARTGRPC